VDILHLLITEVTEIHRGTYCVAAWDAAGRRMVRPLPDGINWTRAQIDGAGIVPGTRIAVTPNRIRPRGSYPHHTEDLPIDPSPVERLADVPVDWLAAGAPPLAPTLAAAFGGQLRFTHVWHGHRRGAHVVTGTRVNSLHGVRIPSRMLSFVETDDRLRALLRDAEAGYDLPVTSRALREVWRAEGIAAVRRMLPVDTLLHVRAGLARGWGDHADKCYVMLNGVLW
jgi:hypothetical protein